METHTSDKFVCLNSKGLAVFENENKILDVANAQTLQTSKFDTKFGYVSKDDPSKLILTSDGQTFSKPISFNKTEGITKFYFSPNYTFVVILFEKGKNKFHNFCVYNTHTHTIEFEDITYTSTHPFWPVVYFTDDEKHIFRMKGNNIIIYEGNFSTLKDQFKIENLSGIYPHQYVIKKNEEIFTHLTLIAMSVGKDHIGQIHIYKNFENVHTLTFKDVDEIEILGSKQTPHFLVKTHSYVNQKFHSYYGSDLLYFIKDENDVFTSRNISEEFEGPLHDVQWNPVANEFMCIAGNIPPEIRLYSGHDGYAFLSLGNSHKNKIIWNSDGNLFLLGGFGNMAGQVCIWDRFAKKMLCEFTDPMVTFCEFLPSGTHVLMATTSPRLTVENSIRVYDHMGNKLFTHTFDKLWSVQIFKNLEKFKDKIIRPNLPKNLITKNVETPEKYFKRFSHTSLKLNEKTAMKIKKLHKPVTEEKQIKTEQISNKKNFEKPKNKVAPLPEFLTNELQTTPHTHTPNTHDETNNNDEDDQKTKRKKLKNLRHKLKKMTQSEPVDKASQKSLEDEIKQLEIQLENISI